MKKRLLALFIFHSLASGASTFVGNGGGRGDIELEITLSQVRDTFRWIAESGAEAELAPNMDDLCTCDETHSERGVCDALRGLNKEQTAYCAKALRLQAAQILKLIGDRARVRYLWSEQPIEVREGEQTRAVDAVTNRNTSEICFHLDRFIAMRPAERLFLVSHELLHLTDWEGKPLTDSGPVGPFEGVDGGRRFLNSIGAAVAVQHDRLHLPAHQEVLNRSQSWRHWWVGIDVGSVSPVAKADGPYPFSQFASGSFTLRYQWAAWGAYVNLRSERKQKKILDTIDAKEDNRVISVGLSRRHFFFSDPLSYWGQSHLLLQVGAEYLQGRYSLSEKVGASSVDFDDRSQCWGARAEVSYYLPIVYGFWGYAGAGFDLRHYSYSNINVNYQKGAVSSFLGVAYGF